jgi:protein-disulfide isomerase
VNKETVVGKQARSRSRELRQAREAAQRRSRRRNQLIAGGGGLVILGLVVAIVVGLLNAARRPDEADRPSRPLVAPAAATARGSVLIGQASAPVQLEVFLDYMCPFCGKFERANGADIERLIADGTVRLEVYPLSFLDRSSADTRYSTRAANAVVTVADRAPDRLLAFHAALFAHQPKEGGPGLSDDQIGDLARRADVPEAVVSTFSEGTFEPWIAKVTEAAFGNGLSGTPTVKINGKLFQGDLYTAGPLARAVEHAKSQ